MSPRLIPDHEQPISEIEDTVRRVQLAATGLQDRIYTKSEESVMRQMVELQHSLADAVAKLWVTRVGLRFLPDESEKERIWTEHIIADVRRYGQGLEDETFYLLHVARDPVHDDSGRPIMPKAAFTQLLELSAVMSNQQEELQERDGNPIVIENPTRPTLIYLCDLATHVNVLASAFETACEALGDTCRRLWGHGIEPANSDDDGYVDDDCDDDDDESEGYCSSEERQKRQRLDT